MGMGIALGINQGATQLRGSLRMPYFVPMETILAQPIGTVKREMRGVTPARPVNRVESNLSSEHTGSGGAHEGFSLTTLAHGETTEKNLLEMLRRSQLYQEYERAFNEATGLPVALRAIESWQLPHHGRKNENALCSMVAQKSRSCAACLQLQEELSKDSGNDPKTLTCYLGLSDTVVPVRLGEKIIGFLQTGQVFCRKPSEAQFEKVSRLLDEWKLPFDKTDFRDAYFGSRVMAPKQYDSMVKLLGIFGQHLSILSNQITLQQENSEPPVITRAKRFIEEHHGEDLSLGQVAKAVNTSTFYFCKIFKKATGLNFTDYVSRLRIEKAKNLLLNPNLRVSEIAFEVGFQSLTHFNRVFRRVVGQSPTDYRSNLKRV